MTTTRMKTQHCRNTYYRALKGRTAYSPFPEYLVVDGGCEFHSRALVEACAQWGITVQICPPVRPNVKPVIEEFFTQRNRRSQA
jgi:hypothetical protein